MNKIFIVFLLILTSWGYQPIYKATENTANININEVFILEIKKLMMKFIQNPFILIRNMKT